MLIEEFSHLFEKSFQQELNAVDFTVINSLLRICGNWLNIKLA